MVSINDDILSVFNKGFEMNLKKLAERCQDLEDMRSVHRQMKEKERTFKKAVDMAYRRVVQCEREFVFGEKT